MNFKCLLFGVTKQGLFVSFHYGNKNTWWHLENFTFFNEYYLINLNFNRFLFKLKLNITNKMFLKYLNKKKL